MNKSSNDAVGRTFFLPIHRHQVIRRHELIRQIFQRTPALTVLRGPGGIGKSILAAQVAEEFASRTPSAHVVWVRFRPGLVGFEPVWQHIIAECRKAGLVPPGSLVERIATGGISTPEMLIEALDAWGAPLLLVIDDAYFSITTEVEESLLDALERVNNLTVVITSRRPLAVLTSASAALRVPIVTLNKQDLYMTSNEVHALVKLRSPAEANPEAIAHAVHQQSRGWPLAIHALLVERENLPENTNAPLDATPQRAFLQNIVNTMLKELDTVAKDALYILAQYKEVSSEVLAATLEIEPEQSHTLLQETLIEHLDYWIDDECNHWYQIHDLLGSEILRQQASLISESEKDRVLYGQRISTLLRESRPRIAMQAAIIAQDWDTLSDLLLDGTAITLSREQFPVTLSHIPEEIRAKYPVIAAFSLLHEYAFPSGFFAKTVAGFKAYSSRALMMQAQRPGFHGLTATILKMIISRITGNEKLALTMAEQVTLKIDALSDEERRRYSVPLQVGVNQTAITYLHMGHFHEARNLLGVMYMWREYLQPKSRAHAVALAAWAAASCGDMKEPQTLLNECEQLNIPAGWHDSYIGAGYRIAAALHALENDEHDLAQQHIEAMAAHDATIEHWPYLAYVQALTIESRDGAGAALAFLRTRTSRRNARTSTTVYMRNLLRALHARLSWQQGLILPIRKSDSRGIAAVYVVLSRNDLNTAITLSARLEQSDLARESMRAYAEIMLLRAVIATQQDNLPLATEHARVAASIMEASGTSLPMRAVPRQIASHLQELVPELPLTHAPEAVIHDVEPLSKAEHRALIAVAEHGTISQAAKAMCLSRETVKGHMKSVYRKLKVNSRDEAVAVANTTGLLTHPLSRDNDSEQ